MEKKGYKFYENLYLKYLSDIKAAKSENDKKAAYKTVEDYRKAGLAIEDVKVDKGTLSTEEHFEYKNQRNYKKFAKKNTDYMVELGEHKRTADDEVSRIKRRRYTYRILTGVVATGLIIALVANIRSCGKNKTNGTTTVSSTIETTLDDTTTTTTIGGQTTSGTTSGTSSSSTTEYDPSKAIESINKDMEDVVIINGTEETTYNNGGNGGNDGGYSYGDNSGNGSGNNDVPTTTTTNPTFPTTTTTTTTTAAPTATPIPTPTPVPATDPAIPTTETSQTVESTVNGNDIIIDGGGDNQNPTDLYDTGETDCTFFTFAAAKTLTYVRK